MHARAVVQSRMCDGDLTAAVEGSMSITLPDGSQPIPSNQHIDRRRTSMSTTVSGSQASGRLKRRITRSGVIPARS